MQSEGPFFKTLPGKPVPLGATYRDEYTQFAVFSRHAEEISLLFFDQSTDKDPAARIRLDPAKNKTGDVWHIQVFGIRPGQLYGFSAHGPYLPKKGHRFNANKLLIDPYAKALTGDFEWQLDESMGYNWNSPKKDLSLGMQTNYPSVPKSIVIDDAAFDWEGDVFPRIALADSIIYEVHLKGFTCHPDSGVKNGGTFAGLIEKIPYLKELGVTAVELLPIQEFDARENFRTNPFTGEKLANYWGYSTISFFAPKGGYALENGRGEQVLEFKRMVKALHKEGLELILDVVFNHTAEGNQMGPTLNFRGLDNTIYYILENGRYYKNFSGCGNTMNCNHPVVREYILNCLRYWVTEMHVDGFRFDLASILGRGPDGSVLENPPILEQISEDPVLRDTKIIAEAWDAAGLYQVGSFPGGRWAEWNGKYRDTLRAFWKGDEGRVSELATRLAGSSDLYEHSGRRPFHSINFITCHDGFTLEDLVSYNEKHNEANAENNTDGENNNMSFNYGHEGETEDREILAVRLCQRKNFMASLLVSQGVPMMLGGDEMGRTQSGNNNAWCQDNEISWMSWERLEKNRGFFRFVRCLIRLRKEHIVLRRNHFFSGNDGNADEIPDVSWFDHRGHDNPWHDKAKTLAFFLSGSPEDTGFEEEDDNFYFMMNAHHKPVSFRLPPVFRELSWKRVVDTSKTEPEDIYESGSEPDMPVDGLIPLEGRSLIVLINKTT